MLEYGLLFALGFFAALLAGLFVAPAIHRRVVIFTEKRLKATVPFNRAELRAQRDMDRAEHAVENRRVAMELRKERDGRAQAIGEAERLKARVRVLDGEIEVLNSQIETMTGEAGDLRIELKRGQEQLDTIKAALDKAERGVLLRDETVDQLSAANRRLSIDVEDAKIDLATRGTEIESLRAGMTALTDERRTLREQIKRLEADAKDAAYRGDRDEKRIAALEGKLTEAQRKLSDQESVLERRNAETARLRERLKTATADMKAAEASLRQMERERGRLEAALASAEARSGLIHSETLADRDRNDDMAEDVTASLERTSLERMRVDRGAIGQRVEKLRARHTALVDRLSASDPRQDQELRSEIKEIAATMVSLTAEREGRSSPIHALLAQETDPDGQSLAARSLAMLREN
jgi:chromosome segregation ATPase